MAVELGPLGTFDKMLELAREKGPRRCIVACAEDCATLEALNEAEQEGIVEGVLYGDRERILTICASLKVDMNRFEVHDVADQKQAVAAAVKDAAGKGDFLMKGQVDTATFLHGVLVEGSGLRDDRILSHVAYLELPSYHKTLSVTDGGINAELDLKRKIDIVRNAIELSRFLGNPKPKVALLSSVEKINLHIAETLDWAVIARMGEQGEFGDAVVEGPLAVDVVLSKESARIKRVASQVSGDVDILVVPSMATGNILAKGLQYLGGAKACGIVVGARKPIVMLSRSDTPETKLHSMAMGNLVSWR